MRKLDALVYKTLGLSIPPEDECSHGPLCLKHGTFPKYSTDIRAAWELVTRLERNNPPYHFRLFGSQEFPGESYAARFKEEYGDQYTYKSQNPATAICLAFLRAKNVPEEEITAALIKD